MLREDVIAKTNEVFVQDFELEPDQLRPDAQIFNELGLDSLDTVDLIVALQKKFGVTIRDDERVRDIRTLNDLYVYIENVGVADVKE